MGAASAVGVTWMAHRAQGETDEGRAPLLGVMGAFVFAAQMINFPVGVGTTGHLLGGALLAFTLGPASAIVVMTAILAIQALVFQDGGVLALGANVFNMAVAGVLAGYLPYHLLGRGKARGIAIFVGGVLSVITAALLALAELWFSGVRMPGAIVALSLAVLGGSRPGRADHPRGDADRGSHEPRLDQETAGIAPSRARDGWRSRGAAGGRGCLLRLHRSRRDCKAHGESRHRLAGAHAVQYAAGRLRDAVLGQSLVA
jgi:cobalamin biosynthesis protein CbiM